MRTRGVVVIGASPPELRLGRNLSKMGEIRRSPVTKQVQHLSGHVSALRVEPNFAEFLTLFSVLLFSCVFSWFHMHLSYLEVISAGADQGSRHP